MAMKQIFPFVVQHLCRLSPKNFLMKTGLILAVFSLMILPSCEKDEDNGSNRSEWTILGYFNGNNDLDIGQAGTSYIIKDLQEMERVGSNNRVRSVVMLGSLKTGGNVACYEIEKHENQLPDEIHSPVALDVGTRDMSDPQTLVDFLSWAVENYPADHYALIINSHGAGWYGLCPDEINGSDALMNVPKLRTALSNAPHLDVIVFHACLMGTIEVAYELKDNADYMVACETTMPALGILGADTWLAELMEDPGMEAFDLSKRIAQCVYDQGVMAQRYPTHMAVVDLSRVEALGARTSEFGNRLVSEVGDNWGEVFMAWQTTHYISPAFPSFTDLREFIKQLMKMGNISQINLINNAANEVLSALNASIPFTKSNSVDQPYGGLSIHFPNDQENFDQEAYKQLQFSKTYWHNFLAFFMENAGGGGGGGGDEDQAVINGTVTWPGHTLSQNTNVLVCYDSNGELEILGSVAVNPDGTYRVTITGLEAPVEFLFCAHDDQDNDGSINAGDGFGFWDKNNDNTWTFNDALSVAPGNQYDGINIQLSAQKAAAAKAGRLLPEVSDTPRKFEPSGILKFR